MIPFRKSQLQRESYAVARWRCRTNAIGIATYLALGMTRVVKIIYGRAQQGALVLDAAASSTRAPCKSTRFSRAREAQQYTTLLFMYIKEGTAKLAVPQSPVVKQQSLPHFKNMCTIALLTERTTLDMSARLYL